MLTASEIPHHFAVYKPELNSCTFKWKPYLLWFDFLSQRRITTVPNYVLSLVNCCCHTSPHASIISCGLARFQEPLQFFSPLLHMHACQQAAQSKAGPWWWKKKWGKRGPLYLQNNTQVLCVPLLGYRCLLEIISDGVCTSSVRVETSRLFSFFLLQFEKQGPALITECVSV